MVTIFGPSFRTPTSPLLGSEIRLELLIEILLTTDVTDARWPQIMALCLYSQFLLISASGHCDSKILHILDQVESGHNPFPLILVETLVGLDNFTSLG